MDGALQRIIINGNAIEDLIEVSKNSRGITKYVGPPCDDEKSQQNAKCMNGGVCTPFFRSYVCKCTKDYIGPKCEKSKQFIIYINQRFFKTQSPNMINFLFFLFFWLYYVSRNIFINLCFECKLISSFLFPLFYYIQWVLD